MYSTSYLDDHEVKNSITVLMMLEWMHVSYGYENHPVKIRTHEFICLLIKP